jgi:Beta-lactamase enzyme family
MRRLSPLPRKVAVISALAFAIAGCTASSPAGGQHGHGDPASGTPGPPASSAPGPARSATSPFASLRRYLRHRSGRVTAAVYDARTGGTWVLRPRLREDTASIVKVQIMGTALREAEESGETLPRSEAALMTPMIEYSDNDAATTLLADVGGPAALLRFDLLAGMRQTTPSTQALIPGTDLPGWGLTTTSALDQVRLVSAFAYPGSVLSAADRAYGLSLMEHVEDGQNWGVSGGVPAGTTIALKNGWLPLANAGWQVNSIGWVHGHGRDYVLAVLTDHSPSEAYGIDTVQAIAARVYAELRPSSRRAGS